MSELVSDVFYLLLFTEHTQVTPGLPMLQMIYYITYIHNIKVHQHDLIILVTSLVDFQIQSIDV